MRLNYKNIFIGVIFTIFFISAAVIFTINYRSLYYFDIDYLNLEQATNQTKEELINNYDTLIDYCSPFSKENLKFPTLPSSKEAIIHFEEVKEIFIGLYLLCIISFLSLLLIIRKQYKKKDYQYLITSSKTMILLPVLVGAGCSINFNYSFTLFHKLFFRNDYWIFDATTDPIILQLPQTFFLHCAILIVLFVLLASGILYFIGNRLCRSTSGVKQSTSIVNTAH